MKIKSIIKSILLFPILTYASTPTAPSELVLKALSATTVSVKWKDNSSDESGFKIFRNGNLIHTTTSNIEQYTDSGLTALTTYEYTIKATNSDEVIHATLQKPILNGNDDVEERADGSIYNTSSDLELTTDSGAQTIGLRFQSLSIPKDAIITKAYIQFTADETSSETTNLTIHAEATDNASEFIQTSNNISSRVLTSTSANWSPPAWNSIGEHSQAQATPDLSSIVQEIINRNGWQSGNSIAFIISGSGKRVAESFDGGETAPLLHIEYDSQEAPPPPANETDIVINEILTANASTNYDPDFYQFSDWIELYNGKNQSIDISGFYLSDDVANPTKYKIPSGTTIASHGYLLIWADEENTKSKAIHTNFKLSQKGETLTLADRSGNVIDTIEFTEQDGDISCAKVNETIVYMEPTPKSANSQTHDELKRSKKPTFSLDSGFYTGTQSIALTQKNGGSIYYTLDGSIPTKNSTLYTQSISIDKTTVIRARAYENGKFLSNVKNQTYFINLESSLPVISLSIDDGYLNDNTIGIYVTGTNGIASNGCYRHIYDQPSDYKNFNQNWKRPVYIEYFDENNQKAFNIGADISISGQCSRYISKKSFSIDLSSKYGDKSLKYPSLYPSKEYIDKVKDFKLRSGMGGFSIADVLAAMIVENANLDIDYQGYIATRMFVNGKYWGVYNLREKKGKDYIKSNYPDIGKVDIVAHAVYKTQIDTDIAKSGDLEAFNVLKNYVESHNLSNGQNYQKLLTMINKNSYLDYMIFMIYSGSSDWLYNNIRFWREKKEGAKWRWMLDDVDGGFVQTIDEFDSFDKLKNTPTFMATLFNKLLTNSTFKQEFKSRFNSYLDTVFRSENILPLISQLTNERRGYLDGGKWGSYQSSSDYYEQKYIDFANRRVGELRNRLNQL